MKVYQLFENTLLEFKSVRDFRHDNIEKEFKFFGSTKTSEWIDPKEGFYWLYDQGDLILASTDNENYSALVSSGLYKKVLAGENTQKAIKQARDGGRDLWNQLGGIVNFKDKTITIAKENVGKSNRMRVIYDIKKFQSALKNLKGYGVKEDFKIKGTNKPFLGMTVGDVLGLSGSVERIMTEEHPTMYHGTSKKRWDEFVEKKGLQPGKTGEAYYDLIKGYSEHHIYLAGDEKTAEFYGKRQAKKEDDTHYVIIQVSVPDTAKLWPDDEFSYAIVQGHAKDDHSVYQLIKASIKANGSLAYRGTIKPTFLKLLATRKA